MPVGTDGGRTMARASGQTPRILLVEDDPVSRSFMQQVLAGLPAQVTAADSIAAALQLEDGHDLWLIDANLPGGDGAGLLAKLRGQNASTPAIAHTADDSPALHARLLAAGFAQVVVKPLAAAQLLHAVRAGLGLAVGEAGPRATYTTAGVPLWDDAVALAALNGNRDNLVTLRGLFLGELHMQCGVIHAAIAGGDLATLRNQLHQLRASSGFVGALKLAAVAARLAEQPDDPLRLSDFDAVASATCKAA